MTKKSEKPNLRTNRRPLVWRRKEQQQYGDLTFERYERLSKTYSVLTADNSFHAHAWTTFDLGRVAALLLCPQPSFVGHKECLFAALCGWIIDPSDACGVRQSMIVSTAAAILTESERRFMSHKQFNTRVNAFYGRLIDLPPPFFTEIYYPIGGLERIREAVLTTAAQEQIHSASWNHQLALTMLGIRHHVRIRALELDPHDVSPILSNASAASIAHVLFDAIWSVYTPAGKKMAKANYKAVDSHVSFTYAAATMQIPHHNSLFRTIFSLVKPHLNYSEICNDWFARANYTARNLIHIEELDQRNSVLAALPCVPAIEQFEPPWHIEKAGFIIADLLKPGAMHRYTSPGGRDALLKPYGILSPEPKRTKKPKGFMPDI